MKLYCLRCKKKIEVGNLKKSKVGTNRWAYKTKCPKCSCGMYQFCSAD